MAEQSPGFVDVGRMGGPMTGRLRDAGHSLCVRDTTPEAVRPLGERGVVQGTRVSTCVDTGLGHGLVREDMHAGSISHHGVVVWPTLLPLARSGCGTAPASAAG